MKALRLARKRGKIITVKTLTGLRPSPSVLIHQHFLTSWVVGSGDGVLLLWHIVGQGTAVLAAGAGWVGYVLSF